MNSLVSVGALEADNDPDEQRSSQRGGDKLNHGRGSPGRLKVR